MYRTLNKINQRPIAYRKRLVLIAASSITLMIAVVWAATLPIQFRGNTDRGPLSAEAILLAESKVVNEPQNPFSVLAKSVQSSAGYAWNRSGAAALLGADIDVLDQESKEPSIQSDFDTSALFDSPEFLPDYELEFLSQQ